MPLRSTRKGSVGTICSCILRMRRTTTTRRSVIGSLFRRGTHNGRAKAVEVRLIMDPARRMVPHEPAVAPCWAAPARAVSPDYRQAPAIRNSRRTASWFPGGAAGGHRSLGPRGSPQTYPRPGPCLRVRAADSTFQRAHFQAPASDGSSGGAAARPGRLPSRSAALGRVEKTQIAGTCPLFKRLLGAGWLPFSIGAGNKPELRAGRFA